MREPRRATARLVPQQEQAAPAGPIIEQIAEATRHGMADKELQGKLIAAGFEPVTDSGPEKTAKFVNEELARWTPLLKASGIKIN